MNASDGIAWTRETYTFTTESADVLTVYATLTFGGKADVQGLKPANVTINNAIGVEETNVTCIGTMINTSGCTTTAWFQADDNIDFGSLAVNTSNGTVGEGELFYKSVTGFDNGTYYYIRTAANNSQGWNYSWNYTTVLTKPQPTTSFTATEIGGGYNLTWTHGNGYNDSVLVMNQDHYPQYANDGQLLQQNKRNYYNHLGLNASDTYYYRVWEYVSFGGLEQFSDGNQSIIRTYAGQQPALYSPYPSNGTNGVNIDLYAWNITIHSPRGKTFNWTIQGEQDIGINGSDNCVNGSYNMTVSGNLSELTTYTVWVNTTETSNTNWTNATYWFRTGQQNLTLYATLTFGGKATVQGESPIISSPAPTNTSFENNMYPFINVTVSDPQSTPINVTWLYNSGSGWIILGYNTTTSGSTVRQRATFANASYTKYNWSVRVNDSDMNWGNATYFFYTANYTWGNWSGWWTFNYTCCCGSNLQGTAYNESTINLTWDNCTEDGCDVNVLVVNETGWPNYPYIHTNGTEIYNGTDEYYNHTNLGKSTTYYYTLWGYNGTNNNYSIVNRTVAVTTQGDVDVCCPYPGNQSTGNSRPPTNVSAHVNGTNVDIYFYFMNMTPVTNTSTLFASWTGENDGRFDFTTFNWTNPETYDATDWIWGDTTYTWYVNATDGSTWYNQTFNYTTGGSRYDVSGSGDVVSADAYRVWTNRAGEASYNGIYDVNQGGDITPTDAYLVWINKT